MTGTQLVALVTAAAAHSTPTSNWDKQINAECEDLSEKTVLERGRLKPTASALQSQRARQAEALPVWGCSGLLSAHTASRRLSTMRQSKLGLGRREKQPITLISLHLCCPFTTAENTSLK